MIDRFKKQNFIGLLDFLKTHRNSDFYITDQNVRIFANDEKSLKKILHNSNSTFINEEKGNILGVVLVWCSLGNNIKRYFVKLNATNIEVVRNLLTVLLWNYQMELYIKIRKDSPFVNILKEKGFFFVGDRGREILLRKYQTKKPIIKYDYNKE
jgi:hypothetical protein